MKDNIFISPASTFFASIIFTLMLGLVDWASGYELEFFVFYFIPIAVAGWTCTPLRAYFVAVLGAWTWFMADGLTAHSYSYPAFAAWNTGVRLVAFLVLAHAVSRIRILLDQERNLSSELHQALSEVKALKGLLPICASCKRIRNDQGYWQQLESYISTHTDATFTHGICHDCADKMLKDAGLPPLIRPDTPPGSTGVPR